MIGDLLDLTRVRLGGTISLKRRRADLRELCEEAILESGAANPEAVLRLQTSGNLVGNWDADRLAQVVSNLVVNAIQHGHGTPVTLTAVEEGDAVTLEVHNSGVPIPPAMMPSIFEPLARGGGHGGQRAQHRSRLVHRAGDRVGAWRRNRCEFFSDQGTTFTARLPKVGLCSNPLRLPPQAGKTLNRSIRLPSSAHILWLPGDGCIEAAWPPYLHPRARRTPAQLITRQTASALSTAVASGPAC